MPDRQTQDARRLVRLATLLALVTVLVIVLDRLTGCSSDVKERLVQAPPPPPAEAPPPLESCDNILIGDTVDHACPTGQIGKIVMICTDTGLAKGPDTCVPSAPPPGACAPGATTFAQVQPILTKNCNGGCHTGYDDYTKARTDAAKYARRIALPANDGQHMPRGGQLTSEPDGGEIGVFSAWVQGGFCPKPAPTGESPPTFLSLDEMETIMLSDITDPTKVEVADRHFTRYLLAVDQVDAGASAETIQTYYAAGAKSVNSVSPERELEVPVKIAPGIYRIRLNRLGISAAQWQRIEGAELASIVSRTAKGQLLRVVSQAPTKPWMFVESFNDTILRNAPLYYDLTRTPQTFNELTQKIGVNFQGDLRDRRDVIFSTFSGSPLSPNLRMVTLFQRSRDGMMSVTFDTGIADTPEKNLLNFPCLIDLGCQLDAQFLAGEIIYSLPNGLHGYMLTNAKQTVVLRQNVPVFARSDLDRRLDAADPVIVRDRDNPASAIISSGISCFRCHSAGLISVVDQVRAAVTRNAAQYGADAQVILKVYKPRAEMDTAMKTENDRYQAALVKLGISSPATTKDPVSIAEDAHLNPWPVAKVCGSLLLRPTQCQELLNQSATAQAQWGQLTSGAGSITFDQYVQSLKAVIAELNLFNDPI